MITSEPGAVSSGEGASATFQGHHLWLTLSLAPKAPKGAETAILDPATDSDGRRLCTESGRAHMILTKPYKDFLAFVICSTLDILR